MSTRALDRMTHFAVRVLASGDDRQIASLVRQLAAKWPDQPALAIAFALTSAASSVEDMVDRQTLAPESVLRAYKFSALVAADVYAIEAMGRKEPKGSDLLHFWRRVDPFFLDL